MALIRNQLTAAVKPGITTAELDKLADKLISRAGGQASFKMVPGYHWATCMNVNQMVVHGIPNQQKLKADDVLGIDVGLYWRGFHTDTSVTVKVNGNSNGFLKVGKKALKKAIDKAKPGNRVADLSRAMQQTVEDARFSVVRALTGHGIGRHLHEEPAVPCFVVGSYSSSPKLIPGMVLAIEIMYNLGTSEVVYQNADGWTIITADDKISGLFEETVVVTAKGPIVLTTPNAN